MHIGINAGLTMFFAIVFLPFAAGCRAEEEVRNKENANTQGVSIDSAVVTIYIDVQPDGSTSRSIAVENKEDIKRLAKFFPGAGADWSSPIAGAWERLIDVKFVGADEKTFTVASNFKYWSEGRGDRDVAGDLESFTRALFKKDKEQK